MRHPQFTPLQWSHHQKFVVIDDKHAFAGGVDFSTGRFDWHEHHVVDPDGKYWWGIVSITIYSNKILVPVIEKRHYRGFSFSNNLILSILFDATLFTCYLKFFYYIINVFFYKGLLRASTEKDGANNGAGSSYRRSVEHNAHALA
jgi:hypothetical protein